MPSATSCYYRMRAEFDWSLPDFYNIATEVRGHSQSHPDDHALIVADRSGGAVRHTYAQLNHFSDQLANRLTSAGMSVGDRIAIMLPPSFEAATGYLAALKAGLVVVPLLGGSNARAIAHRLRESRAKVLLLDRNYLPTVETITSTISEIDLQVFVLRDGPGGGLGLLESVVAGARVDFKIVPTRPMDPAFLVYTSGSDGDPKGVLHGHREVLAARTSFGLRSHPPKRGEVAWSTADWSWLMGLNIALMTWQVGGAILVEEDTRFNPAKTVEFLTDFGVHHVSLPPSALILIQKADNGVHKPGLKSITTGGEALPGHIYDWVKSRFGVVLDELYAMSECPALIGTGDLAESRRGSLGLALPGHDVQVTDENGVVLAPGETGRIAVHKSDPGLFLGYWQDGRIKPPEFAGDYFLTSDLGQKDSHGHFWYFGRSDDVIKSGGYRIGPGEIEDCALAHPNVRLAGAIGVPDPLLGQVVKLFIQPGGAPIPVHELKQSVNAHLRERLSPYQMPRTIEIVESLPMTSTGKVERRTLRQMAPA